MLAYFDCFSGLAGDMIVAALLDAGADWDELRKGLSQLKLPGFEVHRGTVKRAGLRACLFSVDAPPTDEHRSLPDILSIIETSQLSDTVKANASKIFHNLATAEAKVHDCETSRVHFHEVGAVDAIIDIVGACICLELLGISDLYFPPVPVGSGTVQTSHGLLPIPAPGTLELLRGYKLYCGGEGELTTPTGAAIVTGLGAQVSDLPELTVRSVGYGAGGRDDKHRPNVLRVIIGEPVSSIKAELDQVCMLSCQIDDMTGEELAFLAERLRSEGALDVFYIPIYMKKDRPAVMLEVTVDVGDADRMTECVLRESTTFGVRRSLVGRYKLGREIVEVDLPAGGVKVKLGYIGEEVVKVNPEYEDCRRLALGSGKDLREIYAEASAEARRMMEKKRQKRTD